MAVYSNCGGNAGLCKGENGANNNGDGGGTYWDPGAPSSPAHVSVPGQFEAPDDPSLAIEKCATWHI